MREHDVDHDGGRAAAATPQSDVHEAPSGQLVGHGLEAGRPDVLGPGGLLHLQRTVGNRGVTELVAQAGRPLDAAVRGDMESTLGHDFGDVEVHTDGVAAASAHALQAHAYTVGTHVVFGEGRYQPGTTEGRRTLAHELTHVVQQRQGPVDGTPTADGLRVSDPGDRFEREAESAAESVAERVAQRDVLDEVDEPLDDDGPVAGA
ncbi:MAG TPA: DUF4157 domain-containing protein [Acidimicrobiales bacterium]|nr:DUF4157 domain-containing protein [Acidimicrobiales bacterium]